VYSLCTVSSRNCKVSRMYRNKVDSRLHEFGVLKERDSLAKAEIQEGRMAQPTASRISVLFKFTSKFTNVYYRSIA